MRNATIAMLSVCAALSVAFGKEKDVACERPTAAEVAEFKAAALGIAERKIAEAEDYRLKNGRRPDLKRRIATGGSFSGYFLWDTAFAVIWASRLEKGVMPAVESLDNLYALADENGFINREYTADGVRVWEPSHPIAFAPPLLTWAEMELFRRGHTDDRRLKAVFPKLCRHHAFCKAHYRRADGLYFGDQLGCGMDDLRRYPQGLTTNQLMASGGIPFTIDSIGPDSKHFFTGWMRKIIPVHCWNRQMGWIDMSSQMALDALKLAEMAAAIGNREREAEFMAEHAELKDAINRLCWNEGAGFYCDSIDGKAQTRRTAAGFWVLIAKVATSERAARVRDTLMDERVFFRPVPFPALAADDGEYCPETGYWNGSSWPPTTYVAIRGLMEYGYRKEAETAAIRYYRANLALYRKFGTIFENVSPEQSESIKKRAARDFCGWGALSPIALPVDFGW